eukprot:scaffold25487_cov232-Isochrysis_galbana.AAC.2
MCPPDGGAPSGALGSAHTVEYACGGVGVGVLSYHQNPTWCTCSVQRPEMLGLSSTTQLEALVSAHAAADEAAPMHSSTARGRAWRAPGSALVPWTPRCPARTAPAVEPGLRMILRRGSARRSPSRPAGPRGPGRAPPRYRAG